MRNDLIEKVEKELARYEHPLFEFSCRSSSTGVDLIISLKNKGIYADSYSMSLSERDITGTQFPWAFQRLLYGCLHDYIIGMFERNPQSRT